MRRVHVCPAAHVPSCVAAAEQGTCYVRLRHTRTVPLAMVLNLHDACVVKGE